MERYFELDAFLELARNGSHWWNKATDDKKRKMADLIVSNVIIKGNKVASVSLAEPFHGWSLREKNLNGRVLAAQLERLRLYHREHGQIGNRYVQIIRTFNPAYTPPTEQQLASLRGSFPVLTVT